MHGYLAHLGSENIAFYSDEVTDVKKFFENDIVGVLVIAGTEIVAADIYLYSSLGVLEFQKRSFAHDASAHDASGDAYFAARRVVIEGLFDFFRMARNRKFGGGIGVYSAPAHLVETAAAHYFLFAEF